LRQATLALPDLILLDEMMPPGIDGFEACRRLKHKKLPGYPGYFYDGSF
jgi:CheY-like chemotaxis protein